MCYWAWNLSWTFQGARPQRTIHSSSGTGSAKPLVHGFSSLLPLRCTRRRIKTRVSRLLRRRRPRPSGPDDKVELPEGDGKPIATEYCQDCHRLTTVTKARKTSDEWLDSVHLMMDRGARIPDDKVDTLVQYLAKNFGPQAAAPTQAAPVATPSCSAQPGACDHPAS